MEDSILFHSEGSVELPSFYSEEKLLLWFDKISSQYDIEFGELNFIFCDDDYILSVNQEHLNHDYFTDVITFDYSFDTILHGDVYISLDTVKSNAEKFQTTYCEEFHRVVCHSILHLIGYKDKTESEQLEMRSNENLCLKLL